MFEMLFYYLFQRRISAKQYIFDGTVFLCDGRDKILGFNVINDFEAIGKKQLSVLGKYHLQIVGHAMQEQQFLLAAFLDGVVEQKISVCQQLMIRQLVPMRPLWGKLFSAVCPIVVRKQCLRF